MTIQRMIELLENERDCLQWWSYGDCDMICSECDLKRDNGELYDMYTNVISVLKEYGKPDCEHTEHDGIGCLGYAGCTQDDEPIEACKECEKYTGNIYWDGEME